MQKELFINNDLSALPTPYRVGDCGTCDDHLAGDSMSDDDKLPLGGRRLNTAFSFVASTGEWLPT